MNFSRLAGLLVFCWILASTPLVGLAAQNTFVYSKDLEKGNVYKWNLKNIDFPSFYTWGGLNLSSFSALELHVNQRPLLRGTSLSTSWFSLTLDSITLNLSKATNRFDLGRYSSYLVCPLYVSESEEERYDFFTYYLDASRKGDFAQLNLTYGSLDIDFTWNAKTGVLENAKLVYISNETKNEEGRLYLWFDRPLQLTSAQWGMIFMTALSLSFTLLWKRKDTSVFIFRKANRKTSKKPKQ